MWNRSSRRWGLTLIEVVAGIALLSTLLVAILLAHNKHTDQVRLAQLRLDAIAVAQALLAEWSEWPPVGSEGQRDRFGWRVVQAASAGVIRLEVFTSGPRENILTSVELLSQWSNVD